VSLESSQTRQGTKVRATSGEGPLCLTSQYVTTHTVHSVFLPKCMNCTADASRFSSGGAWPSTKSSTVHILPVPLPSKYYYYPIKPPFRGPRIKASRPSQSRIMTGCSPVLITLFTKQAFLRAARENLQCPSRLPAGSAPGDSRTFDAALRLVFLTYSSIAVNCNAHRLRRMRDLENITGLST